jgi:hypothetical protein
MRRTRALELGTSAISRLAAVSTLDAFQRNPLSPSSRGRAASGTVATLRSIK